MSNRKRLYFDSEFTGLHQRTTLISIGIVSTEGERFYAEFTDYDKDQVKDWIVENVIQNLTLQDKPTNYFNKTIDKQWHVKGDSNWIKTHLIQFLELFESIEFWSDNLAYDWVLFCQLFGHALHIPQQVYYIPFDLATLLYIKGVDPDITREEFVMEAIRGKKMGDKHNALWDAELVKLCVEKAHRIQ